ncbi:MAG: tetratricopeptide repeat protein [Nitrospinae bacterium]|nr:tetratricopeptide repeat protein [Nitrospinota bacterium]
MRRWLTCIGVLMYLLGEPLAGAAQPESSSAERILAETLHLIQVGRLKDALVPLQELYTAPLREAISPDWQRRLPFLLGYLSFQTGDSSEAVRHLQDAGEIYPELQDYTVWYLGQALVHLGRMQQAQVAFQRLLDAYPDSVHRREALFKAAETSAQAGELSRAMDLYAGYQREFPQATRHGEVHLRLGMLQRDMGDLEGALREWRHLWLEHPEDAAASMVPDLERTLPPTFAVPPVLSERLYQRAERLYRLHRHREALRGFELARAATPERDIPAELLYPIGMAQYHAWENHAAVATFQQLLERAPRASLAPAARLMLARLHLRLEADERFLDTARTLMARFPGSKQAEEVRYLVGHFHRNRGRDQEAMQVFQQVAQRGHRSEFADDAWWYLGWIRYGLGQYQRAAQTWGKLLNTFPASTLGPDALYWQGRALERLGRRGEARSRYERLQASSRQTYYGYLAAARLTGLSPWPWEARMLGRQGEAVGRAPSVPDPFPLVSSDAHALRGAELWAMRLFGEAGEELQAAPVDGAQALRFEWLAAQAFHWAGEHHRSRTILRRHVGTAWPRGIGPSAGEMREMTYPLSALQRLEDSVLDGLDPRFVGALIVAESDWNPRAFSGVGARGLMQLMPDTGRRLAQDLGISLTSEDQLFNPSLNLRLGIAYVRALLQRFDRQLPLAIASYNAGEQEVGKWWAKRGDRDVEEFIANIPFRETRRYVQRVFVYYATYQTIYRGPPG